MVVPPVTVILVQLVVRVTEVLAVVVAVAVLAVKGTTGLHFSVLRTPPPAFPRLEILSQTAIQGILVLVVTRARIPTRAVVP
jgi:membrane glycosyltransferase